jgi:hypothetical protein
MTAIVIFGPTEPFFRLNREVVPGEREMHTSNNIHIALFLSTWTSALEFSCIKYDVSEPCWKPPLSQNSCTNWFVSSLFSVSRRCERFLPSQATIPKTHISRLGPSSHPILTSTPPCLTRPSTMSMIYALSNLSMTTFAQRESSCITSFFWISIPPLAICAAHRSFLDHSTVGSKGCGRKLGPVFSLYSRKCLRKVLLYFARTGDYGF